MSKVIKVNYVQAYCLKHKQMTDHIEYVFNDKTVKYKCRECYKQLPYAYPLYGKQVAQFKDKPKLETEPKQYGRLVA
jgi:hypothetical protein